MVNRLEQVQFRREGNQMDIMTKDGWKQLCPKFFCVENKGPRKMDPWEEKYDRDHDPAFAPKQLKFGS